MQLAALYRYPLKSGAPLALDEAELSPAGLRHDRNWMVADEAGRMLTGRTAPRLVLVRADADDAGLRLEADGMAPLQVSRGQMDQAVETGVWKDSFRAWAGSAAADAWLSEYLGRPLRLLYAGDQPARRKDYAPDLPLAFVDAYPLLLIGEGSLTELNRRLAVPVVMERFRPNLVIAGTLPFAEDEWRRVRIGDIEFEIRKPCERCAFTTVDPDTGELAPDQEPLRTLAHFRRTPAGVLFGQNVLPRGSGLLRVGMPLSVLE